MYDFGFSGDEEGAKIIIQAQHFENSKVYRDTTDNWKVKYKYQPESNFIGDDFVEFEICTGGMGARCSNITTTRINFTFTD